MNYNEFLSSIKAGQYIKTKYREDKPCVRKVSKVTKTQIVITEFWWGNEARTERFHSRNGCRLGDSWYSMTRIVDTPVSSEEAEGYETRLAEATRARLERKRLEEIEVWARGKLFSLFGERLPADSIKVNFSSNNGLQTWAAEIKCENVSEEILVSALEAGERSK